MSVPEDGEVSHLTLDIGSGRAGQGRVATVELEEVRVGGSISIAQGQEDRVVQDLRSHVRSLNLTQKAASLKQERAMHFRKIIGQREESGLGNHIRGEEKEADDHGDPCSIYL